MFVRSPLCPVEPRETYSRADHTGTMDRATYRSLIDAYRDRSGSGKEHIDNAIDRVNHLDKRDQRLPEFALSGSINALNRSTYDLRDRAFYRKSKPTNKSEAPYPHEAGSIRIQDQCWIDPDNGSGVCDHCLPADPTSRVIASIHGLLRVHVLSSIRACSNCGKQIIGTVAQTSGILAVSHHSRHAQPLPKPIHAKPKFGIRYSRSECWDPSDPKYQQDSFRRTTARKLITKINNADVRRVAPAPRATVRGRSGALASYRTGLWIHRASEYEARKVEILHASHSGKGEAPAYMRALARSWQSAKSAVMRASIRKDAVEFARSENLNWADYRSLFTRGGAR